MCQQQRHLCKESIDWRGSDYKSLYVNKIIPRLESKKIKKTTFELFPNAVSKAVIHACTARNPSIRYRITWATVIMMYLKRFSTDKLFDRISSKL